MAVITFDPGLTVWTVLTFGCLLVALTRFAYKPLRKILEQREAAIRDSLEKAEQARLQAEETAAQNEIKLEQAREEVRRMVEDGHKIVAEMKQESEQSAREEAERIVGHARSEINRELQKGLDDLKVTVANLSLRIARQVIREGLDEERHNELADNFIERLKKSHGSRSS